MHIIAVKFRDGDTVNFHFKLLDHATSFKRSIENDPRVMSLGLFSGAPLFDSAEFALRRFERSATIHGRA